MKSLKNMGGVEPRRTAAERITRGEHGASRVLRLLALLLTAVFAVSVLPFFAARAKAVTNPQVKKITCFNENGNIIVQAEYEDKDGQKMVDLWLLGDEAKEGDVKGPYGLIDVNGKTYHLKSYPTTIDQSNKDKFWKNEDGRWVAKDTIYFGNDPKPNPGDKVSVVVSTLDDLNNGNNTKYTDPVQITIPEVGKSTVVDVGGKPEEKKYTLTIKFVGPEGFPAPADHVEQLAEGAEYEFYKIPYVEGYSAKRLSVEGTMPAQNVTETVEYAKTVTLTVKYVGPEGFPAPNPYREIGWQGVEYYVVSPEVEGYIPDRKVVEGIMPAEDFTETVTYTKGNVITGVEISWTSIEFDGREHKPDIVKVTGSPVDPTNDQYELDWRDYNSEMPGEYWVKVTGKNGFSGSATATYKIVNNCNHMGTGRHIAKASESFSLYCAKCNMRLGEGVKAAYGGGWIYRVIGSENQTPTYSSDGFEFDLLYEYFKLWPNAEYSINGVKYDKEKFRSRSGSTIITFTEDLVNALAKDVTHTLRIVLNPGAGELIEGTDERIEECMEVSFTIKGNSSEEEKKPEEKKTDDKYKGCTHEYEWVVTRKAVENEEGEMAMQCKRCGHVKYTLPVSAYAVFNQNTVDKIKAAPKNATVEIITDRWISFHRMVMDTLTERPDVTLKVTFLDGGYKGSKYQLTIPAGTNTATLMDKNGYSGFLFMGGKLGLTPAK